jgi:hypothetical protein
MIREEILAREENKIVNYIENCVTRAGAENREEVLELFDSIYIGSSPRAQWLTRRYIM